MTQLIELRRSQEPAGQGIVIEDYTDHPTLCRHGVWVGLATYFTETVTIAYEHESADLNVFWQLNDDVLYPVTGFLGGGPVLGTPGVHYVWPVDGFQHRISLISTPGTKDSSVNVEVLYQQPPGGPTQYGPSMRVAISGMTIQWPESKLEEERACQARWQDIRNRYVHWHKPKPGETVTGLDHVRGEAAIRLIAVQKTLESLDPDADHELAEALKAELTAQFLRAENHESRKAK